MSRTSSRSTARPADRPPALVRRLGGLLLAGGLVVGLSACANPLEAAVEGLIEGGVENAVEGATGVDIDVDSGSGASLPADWPSDVPVAEGRIISALAIDGIYSVSIETTDAAAAEAGLQALLDAGFTTIAEQDYGVELRSWVMEREADGFTMSFSTSESDGVVLAQYGLSTAQN